MISTAHEPQGLGTGRYTLGSTTMTMAVVACMTQVTGACVIAREEVIARERFERRLAAHLRKRDAAHLMKDRTGHELRYGFASPTRDESSSKSKSTIWQGYLAGRQVGLGATERWL